MATFLSTQMTDAAASPPKLISHTQKGHVEIACFDYTPPATGEPAAGDNIQLCKIPANVTVIETFLAWAAQDAGATLSLGVTGTVAKYMAAQTMTSAGVKFGPTLVAEANLVTTAEETLIGTLATAGIAATTGVLKGFVKFVGH